MARYASNTSVSTEKSRGEIETTLSKYGANAFMYGYNGPRAMIAFEMKARRIRFELPLPDRTAREFTHTPGRGNVRSPQDSYAAWEQSCRQRWRALALAIKAKLEAVECGITSFEEEFLSHIVLPNNQSVGQFMLPQIAEAYEQRKMPPMLPGPKL